MFYTCYKTYSARFHFRAELNGRLEAARASRPLETELRGTDVVRR